MPGIVKAFIESLKPLCGREGNPDVGFIAQSGFPEAIHSRYVEKYLEKSALRLGCRYTGTIIEGDCEGIRTRPAKRTRKLFGSFYQLGQIYGEMGQFDKELVHKLSQPERFPKLVAVIFKYLVKTKLLTSMWDKQLKENGAYEKRFAKPYLK